MIANSIVSKHQNGTTSNDNYSGSESNGLINMEYIDIDNDPSTFSSSSAKLNLPKCSKIEYAGLYWSAVYSVERWGDTIKRANNFDEIKFKLPGQNYTDIKGEIVYDDGAPESKPYLCYQDITSLLQSQNSPNGDYTAANIKATVGKDKRGLGSSGGWIMVVIYKDETQPSRRISIFDGFSSVGNGATVDISYSGFTTIPVGPVKAKMLVGALEGDKSISGDRFKIKDVNNNYQNLETTLLNPNNNFFNGSITINDAHFTDRTPNSENTLGFDSDLFSLINTNNQLITNNQTEADLRFTSKGDVYWVFLNAMSIDIIEPNVELIKTIDDGNGNNIAGNPVDLGNELWYNIAFQNKGNDDAINTVLVDKLPKNVDLSETDIQVPVGVTYTYDPPSVVNDFRGILTFTIPDNLVEKGTPVNNIRLKVKIVDDCNQLRDVCSNRISNQAFVSYKGKTSGIEINEDPSFSGIDNCNNGEVGPSNFLVNVSGCSYERTEIFCGDSIELSAGRGFLSYEWKDENGTVIGNSQTITVTKVGKYTVNKVAPIGCINTNETINVEYINNQPNPLLEFADNIKTCSIDNSELVEVYLCSNSSTSEIVTNYPNDTIVSWQKLNEGSCKVVSNSNCANTDDSCTWDTVKSGNNFSTTNTGNYRLEVKLDNGCFNRFYFNVVEVVLDPQIITENIVCETPGSITINNIPDGYEYSFTNKHGSYQDSNQFSITNSGKYDIYIRKKRNSTSTSCVYKFPPVEIIKKEIDVEVFTEDISCSDSEGEIKAIVSNVDGPFTYKLYKNSVLLETKLDLISNIYAFSVSDSGSYSIEVSTPDNCIFKADKEFIKPEPLIIEATIIRDIDCISGEIELNSKGGKQDYKYAIWSFNDIDIYNSVTDIPTPDFFTNSTVQIPKLKHGTYKFIIVDANNCYSISNSVTINQEPELAFIETINNATCFNGDNGSIEVSVDGSSLDYSISYSIDNGVNYQTSGVFNNLKKDNYSIKIKATKNGNTCFYSRDITISEPQKLSVLSNITTPLSCVNNGAVITPIAEGGKAPYTFSIDNGVTWKTSFTNVAAGTYKVIVKDSNNCTAEELTTVEVNVPKEILFTANTTKCFTGNNGEITVNVTQGNGSYQFSLDNDLWFSPDLVSPNSFTFKNLISKTYTIKVKDNLGCESKTKTYTINPQLTADITVKDISCNYGEIKILSNGGDGNYVYAIVKEGSVVTNSDFGSSNNQPITEVGNYDIYVRDNFGNSEYCEFKETVSVTKLPELVLETSKTNPKCFNEDGKLELTINGGLAPYTISINGSFGYTETTSSFTGSKKEYTNLSVGEYTIQVTSKDNCTKTITTKIDNAKELKAIIRPLVPNCEETDSSNYGFEFEVTENYQPYTLEFSSDNGVNWTSDPVFKGISSGTHVFPVIRILEEDKVSVRCIKVLEPYTIPFLITNLEANVSVAENCKDGISALVEVKEGFGPFQFAVNSTTNWQNPSATNPTQFEFKNLIPGLSYVFYTKDATGCIKQNEIDIYENYTPIVQITGKVVNNTCATTNSGKIEFSFNDPTNILKGELEWELFNKSTNGVVNAGSQIGTSPILVSNLDSGDYYLVVENSESCSVGSLDVTIKRGTEINGTISKVRDIACNLPGVIEIDAISGGFSPYIFTLTSTNFINPIVSNSLTVEIPYSNLVDATIPSTIFVKAIGSSFCEAQLGSLVLSVTEKPEIEDVLVKNCGINKTITIKTKKGKAPYFYSIDNGVSYQENEVFENLNPNTYLVKVKDSNGCISNSKQIEVFPPLELEVTNSNEFECSSAKIVIDVKNGSGNYDFEIKNSRNITVINRVNLDVNPKIISLSNSDTYTVVVYDKKTINPTCSTSKNINVEIPKPIEFTSPITIKNNTCFGEKNGSFTINASGGTGDLSYSIDRTNFVDTNTFSNLAAGDYNVTVKDEKGCSISQKVKIESPLLLTATVLDIKEETCYNSKNASFNIDVSGGTAPYFVKIGEEDYKENQLEFSNLEGGKTYVVSVRDKNNCETNVLVTIDKTEELKAEILDIYEQVCAFEEGSNSFRIKVTGGNAPYKTKIGSNLYIESQFSFSNVTNGEQLVYIKDKNNCEITIKVPISKPIDLKLSLDATVDCNGLGVINANVENEYKDENLVYTLNGSTNQEKGVFKNLTVGKYIVQVKHPKGCIDIKEIEVENIDPLSLEIDTSTLNTIIIDAYGGEPSYTYSIDGKNFQSDNTFLIGESKSYNIIVRDSRGCEVSEVIKGEYVTISIPNFFTPNNDGKNDFWYPEKVQNYHQIKVFIYDRYSRLIKTYNGIQTGWNGSYNNKPLPSGDYWYVVHYKEIFGDQKKLIGNFTLYR